MKYFITFRSLFEYLKNKGNFLFKKQSYFDLSILKTIINIHSCISVLRNEFVTSKKRFFYKNRKKI